MPAPTQPTQPFRPLLAAFLCALCVLGGETALAKAQLAPKTPPAQPAQPADSIPAPDPTKQITTTTTVRPAPPAVVIPPSNWKPGQPIKTADDLLSALENADANFRSLQADLRKTKLISEIEGGGELIYDGKVTFVSEPADAKTGTKGRRMFQVDFTSTIVDKVKRNEQRTFIFDGQWFVERQPDVKQIRKRQIVPPGQTIDPLAIGEGPFPIPIGQKRERILQRFTAELRPQADFPDSSKFGGLPEWTKDTYQLKLIPRPGTDEAKKFQEVRIWYRTTDLLPRNARTVDTDDAVNIFTLAKIVMNQPVPKGAFDTTIPTGWDAQVDEYRPNPGQEPASAAP